MTAQAPIGHWRSAARHWRQVGPPLRPAREDVEFFARTVQECGPPRQPPRVLILGVTPEIYHLAWPSGTDLKAVDLAPSMIAEVWPGPPEDAICADWTGMPLEAGSRDVVLCDGGLHLLRYPDQQSTLATALYRFVAPGGLCIFRLFVPPPERSPYRSESVDSVLDQLLAGRIADLNLLKFRLWMALQRSATEGVAVHDVWRVVHDRVPNFDVLARRIKWEPEQLRALDIYRDSPNRYHFVTSEEATAVFCQGQSGFQLNESFTPTYALGDQCPTLVFYRPE